MDQKRPSRVLFVCLGNICRSPAAEGVMRRLVTSAGLEPEIEIASAGTGGWHVGELPDARMRAAAAARDLVLASRGRQIAKDDLDRFDLVVAMDRENQRGIDALRAGGDRGRAEVRLLSSFLPAGWPVDVPDPYYGGEAGFERVLDMLEAACPAIRDHLVGVR